MTIFVDARLLNVNPLRGMARYLNALIQPIRRDRIILLTSPGRSLSNFRDFVCMEFGFANYVLWEQVSLPTLLFKEQPEFFIAPFHTSPVLLPKNTKLVLVLHDLIFFERSLYAGASIKHKLGAWYRSVVNNINIKRASVLLCPSDYTKSLVRDLANGIPIVTIPNTHQLVGIESRPIAEVSGAYMLSVTGDAPNKNLDGLLCGYVRLRDKYPLRSEKLVLVGGNPSRMFDAIQKCVPAALRASVIFLAGVTDNELLWLYQNASLYVSSSVMEGFGIPLIEAMHYGVPIACSRASCYPEVTGSNAFFFDPVDVAGMADTIHSALTDMSLRERFKAGGLTANERYTQARVLLQIDRFVNSYLS